MTRVYRVAGIVVGVVIVGVGSFFAGRETATTAPARTTTTTSTSARAATTTTTSTTSTTVVTATCQMSELDITQTGGGGAAGTDERTFSLVNTSTSTCTLYGYPGLLLLGPSATAEPTTVDRGGGLTFENVAPSTVTLAPGATAYFNVGYSDVTPPCSTATAAEVTPPTNTTHAVVSLSQHITACSNGTLHVSAIFGSTNTAATQTTAPS